MANTYIKDPSDVLDYVFDWTSWLSNGEVISTSTTTAPSGINKDSESHTTTKATVWISGGTAGNSYRIANKIVTDQARTVERSVTIQVEER